MASEAERLIEEARGATWRFRQALEAASLDEARLAGAAERLRARVPSARLARAEGELRSRLVGASPARARPGTSAAALPTGIRA
jgi:hypothetical protein